MCPHLKVKYDDRCSSKHPTFVSGHILKGMEKQLVSNSSSITYLTAFREPISWVCSLYRYVKANPEIWKIKEGNPVDFARNQFHMVPHTLKQLCGVR